MPTKRTVQKASRQQIYFWYHTNCNFKKTPKKKKLPPGRTTTTTTRRFAYVALQGKHTEETESAHWPPNLVSSLQTKDWRQCTGLWRQQKAPLSSTPAANSCYLCGCGAGVWYLIGGMLSWARCDSGVNLSSSHTPQSTLSLCLPRARGCNLRIFKVSSSSNHSVIVSKPQVHVRKSRRSRCVTARGKGDNSLSQKHSVQGALVLYLGIPCL